MKRTKFLLYMVIIALLFSGCGKKDVAEDTVREKRTEQKERASTKEITTEEATTEAVTTEEENPKNQIRIALDPGHQSPNVDMSGKEPNAPGSSEMKTKSTGGTTGRFTGIPEYALTLDIALMVRDALEEEGYRVIMTREDNNTAISNMERANLAGDAGADITIRIHANGSEDSGTNGALALVGSESNPNVGSLYEESRSLADAVLEEYCGATGMKNLGIQLNDTMTGINWSRIPVMILEMGFMTNEQDDRNMADADYRNAMVKGIVSGINRYYGFDKTEGPSIKIEKNSVDTELKAIVEPLLQAERDKGTVASLYVKNLNTGEYVELTEGRHRSASLIKLFVAGCLYQNMDELCKDESYEGEIDSLIKAMITVSDNDATNTLVKKLGNGDADAGMKRVTDYAASLGCTTTQMGRLMLDFDSEEENYTSVTDVTVFLEMLYDSEVAGADQILSYMKQQERRGKIPAGIPEGIVIANKTGELDDVEHDAAIVYGGDTDYIICILLSQLPSCEAGRQRIAEISSAVYEYYNK